MTVNESKFIVGPIPKVNWTCPYNSGYCFIQVPAPITNLTVTGEIADNICVTLCYVLTEYFFARFLNRLTQGRRQRGSSEVGLSADHAPGRGLIPSERAVNINV